MARANKRAGKRSTATPRSTATATRRTAAAVSDEDTIADLERLKQSLQAARSKLLLVQPDSLTNQEHAQWSHEVHQLNLAIGAARNAVLGAISVKFAAELPAMNEAMEELKQDLSRLEGSVEVIKAVASALGIIENVVKLLA